MFMIDSQLNFLMNMSFTWWNNYFAISKDFCRSDSFDVMITSITAEVILRRCC